MDAEGRCRVSDDTIYRPEEYRRILHSWLNTAFQPFILMEKKGKTLEMP
jgi:hypothetical protein